MPGLDYIGPSDYQPSASSSSDQLPKPVSTSMSRDVWAKQLSAGRDIELPIGGIEEFDVDDRVMDLFVDISKHVKHLNEVTRSYDTESRMGDVEPIVGDVLQLVQLADQGVDDALELLRDPHFLEAVRDAGVNLDALDEMAPVLQARGILPPDDIRQALEEVEAELDLLREQGTDDAFVAGRMKDLMEVQYCLRKGDPTQVRAALVKHQESTVKGIEASLQGLKQAKTQAAIASMTSDLMRGVMTGVEGGNLLLSSFETNIANQPGLGAGLAEVGVGLEVVSMITNLVALSKKYPAIQALKAEFVANIAAEKQLELQVQMLEKSDPDSAELKALQATLSKQKAANRQLEKVVFQRSRDLTFQSISAGGAAYTELMKVLGNIKSIHSQAAAAQHLGGVVLSSVTMGNATENTIDAVRKLMNIGKQADAVEEQLKEIATWDADAEDWIPNNSDDANVVAALDMRIEYLRQIKTIEYQGKILACALDFTRGGTGVVSAAAKLLALKGAIFTAIGPVGLTLLGGAFAARGMYYFSANTSVFVGSIRQMPTSRRLKSVSKEFTEALRPQQQAVRGLERARRSKRYKAWGVSRRWQLQEVDKLGHASGGRLKEMRDIYRGVAERALGKEWRAQGWTQSRDARYLHVVERTRHVPMDSMLTREEREAFTELREAASDPDSPNPEAVQKALQSFLQTRVKSLGEGWKLEVGDDNSYSVVTTEHLDLRKLRSGAEVERTEQLTVETKPLMQEIRRLNTVKKAQSRILRPHRRAVRKETKTAMDRALPLAKKKMLLMNKLADARRQTAQKAEAEQLGATRQDMREMRQSLVNDFKKNPRIKESFAKFFEEHPECGISAGQFAHDPIEAVMTYMFS